MARALEDVPLTPAQQDSYRAAAESWASTCLPDVPGSECDAFSVHDFATVESLLDGYAGFHSHAIATAAAGGPAPATLRFVPNQYGLGNRLRAMKSALLVAMLTGRVFQVEWAEPFPVHRLLRPERIDWRREALTLPADANTAILCLPFGAQSDSASKQNCGAGLTNLQRADLRQAYGSAAVLEVHTFTDLNIYLAHNPNYAQLLARFGAECPKRMGCLYDYLFSPQPVVESMLLQAAPAAAPPHVGVQVRNRLWLIESMKLRVPNNAARVVQCMARWVPPDAQVFFTAE